MRSTTYDKLDNLYQKFRGYISTQELLAEGFTNRQIAFLTDENYLEKVCHGHYWMPRCGYKKPFDYKCIEVCLSNPRAVIAMKSACYYHKIIKTEPPVLTVVTERTDRSTMKMNFPVERHYFSGKNFKVGIKKVQKEIGHYNIYDIERSLCDIVRFESDNTGREFLIEVFDDVKIRKEQYERILKYAELLKIKTQERGLLTSSFQ